MEKHFYHSTIPSFRTEAWCDTVMFYATLVKFDFGVQMTIKNKDICKDEIREKQSNTFCSKYKMKTL